MKNNYPLWQWIFHYNEHMQMWFAFTRDQYNKYWNGELLNPLKSKKLDVLVEIIRKADGDPNKINKLNE
jgi:hypothetical protein